MKHWVSLLLLMIVKILSAQSLEIEASRTSGTAPLYVFFDATSSTGLDGVNDLPNADFSWDFDVNNTDPTGKWELTKGMVAGHVFEAPGTYTVSCTMIARNGTVDTKEVEITVSGFSGTTYFVSNQGEDTNDGLTEGSPWASANHAFSQLSANTRLLFKRGDIFRDVSYRMQNLGESGIRIGAYGEGDKPQLLGTFNQQILEVTNTQDIVITDLHFVNSGDYSVVYGALDLQDSTNHSLILRCEVEGSFDNAIYFDQNNQVGIFDSHFHDFEFRTLYSNRTHRLSLVGNITNNILGEHVDSHGVRIQGGQKQFIAYNSFTNLINTRTAITIRGDGQRHVMVYHNKMDRILEVNPQNSSTVSAISLVTIEGNYIGQNPDYTGSIRENTINGINIEATNVVIRNNVIDGYRNAINVSHDDNGVVSGDVFVYHNTVNWRPVSPQSNSSGVAVNIRDVSNIIVQNNLITGPTSADVMALSDNGENTNIIVENNFISTPKEYRQDLPFSTADENDASNYILEASSEAINIGSLDVPVFFDQTGGKRYYGSAPDVGAFEYNDGGEVTNPDLGEGRILLNTTTDDIATLYPNPVKEVLYTTFSGHVFIYDLNGRLVLYTNQDKKIDLSKLEKGTYFIQLKNENTNTTYRILKQ